MRERAVLQDAADSAALAAATELRLATPASRRIASLASAYVAPGFGATPLRPRGSRAAGRKRGPTRPAKRDTDHRHATRSCRGHDDPGFAEEHRRDPASRHVPTYMLKYFGAAIDAVRVAATAR